MRSAPVLAAALAAALASSTAALAAHPQAGALYAGTVHGQRVELAVGAPVGAASGTVRCAGTVMRFEGLIARNGGFSTPTGARGISLNGKFVRGRLAYATFSDPLCPAPGGKLTLRLAR